MAGAPMIGGYLNHSFGFRSNFLAIGVFVLISFFVSLFFLKETLPKEKRTQLQLKTTVRDFKSALTSLPFWQVTTVVCLPFTGYIAFLSGTAVLFVVEFGMSKTVFPFIQAALLGGWVAGSLLLERFMAKWGIPKVKKAGILLYTIGGLATALAALIIPRDPYFITAAMTLYAFGANWMIGLYFPEGMEILPNIKGITASLMTSARLLFAALVVGLTSALYNATVYPLAAVVFVTVVLTLPLLFFYERGKAVKSEAS
jgi:MFS transporter, DHA1 family, multidrug resistance protein